MTNGWRQPLEPWGTRSPLRPEQAVQQHSALLRAKRLQTSGSGANDCSSGFTPSRAIPARRWTTTVKQGHCWATVGSKSYGMIRPFVQIRGQGHDARTAPMRLGVKRSRVQIPAAQPAMRRGRPSGLPLARPGTTGRSRVAGGPGARMPSARRRTVASGVRRPAGGLPQKRPPASLRACPSCPLSLLRGCARSSRTDPVLPTPGRTGRHESANIR